MRCRSTRRPGKPSTSGFLPPILDLAKPVAALFPAFGKDKKTIELRHMDRTSVWKLVQTRARACGLQKRVCCHSFRATGITEYMSAGGALDIAQRIAGHSQLSITSSMTDHRTG